MCISQVCGKLCGILWTFPSLKSFGKKFQNIISMIEVSVQLFIESAKRRGMFRNIREFCRWLRIDFWEYVIFWPYGCPHLRKADLFFPSYWKFSSIFLIGIHFKQSWRDTARHKVTRNRKRKRLKASKKRCFEIA